MVISPDELRKNLQAKINAMDITQKQVSEESGVDESTISRFLSGDRKNLWPEKYDALVAWLRKNA